MSIFGNLYQKYKCEEYPIWGRFNMNLYGHIIAQHRTIITYIGWRQAYRCRGLDRLLRLQENHNSKISRQSAQEGGKVVSPTHWPPRRFIFIRGWVTSLISDEVIGNFHSVNSSGSLRCASTKWSTAHAILNTIGYSEYRGMRWRSWMRHCAKSRKVAGSISDGVIGIFHWHNPSTALWHWCWPSL
jgi:hypothetical protein